MIGTGLTWETAYERLQDYGVSIVGARASGVSELRGSFALRVLNTGTWQVGIGGFVLGGGLSLEVLRCFAH